MEEVLSNSLNIHKRVYVLNSLEVGLALLSQKNLSKKEIAFALSYLDVRS